MLNFTPAVLLPSLLQQYAGFPDRIIGEIVGARGAGATVGFFLAMFFGRFDPRIGMSFGFGLLATAGIWLMAIDLNVDGRTLMLNSALQGVAVGVFWVPLTIATFPTLESQLMPEAMALFHLLRNIGSSLFISICVAEVLRTQGANYSRMTEMVSPYNKALSMPLTMGAWTVDTVGGLAQLSKEINRQAAMIGYMNAFGFFTAASAAGIVLIMFAKKRQRKVAA
mgnify:CR=1 FL=1